MTEIDKTEGYSWPYRLVFTTPSHLYTLLDFTAESEESIDILTATLTRPRYDARVASRLSLRAAWSTPLPIKTSFAS